MKLSQLLLYICPLMTLDLCAGGHNNTQGFNGALGCIALDQAQSSGGEPEYRRLLSLGKAAGFERTFEISYQFYSVPDRMVVNYNGANDVKETKTTGEVSGSGVVKFTIPSGSTPFVEITMNAGGGNSGTVWNFVPRETTPTVGTEIKLSAQPCAEGWRNTLGGNLCADASGIVLDPPPASSSSTDKCNRKLFYVDVPAGTTALRVSAVGANPSDDNKQNGTDPASIILSKSCPASSCTFDKQTPGIANTTARNTLVVTSSAREPVSGKWYITVFKRPSARNPLQGGTLRVDCLQGGVWKQADYRAGTFRFERERIAVGIEGGTLPQSGRLLLLSHGRTDSPLGEMKGLGQAVSAKWGRTAYHINWSEGSYWNGGGISSLIGSRFIKPGMAQLEPLLRGFQIDFFGHSWGTYVGNEVATVRGNFERFFALDPANNEAGTGFLLEYDTGSISFSSRAGYSMAVFGGGRFGSSALAEDAHDSIVLAPSNDNGQGCATSPNPVNLARHTEPILVMKGFVNGTVIGSSHVAFALGAGGAVTASRPWKDVRNYEWEDCDTSYFGDDDFHVRCDTNGAGVISSMKYYVPGTGVSGFFFDKEVTVTTP